MGCAGVPDGHSQSDDEEVLRGPAGRSHQQTDAAHSGQTAAPQNLHGAVEPAEAGAQQGLCLRRSVKYTTNSTTPAD